MTISVVLTVQGKGEAKPPRNYVVGGLLKLTVLSLLLLCAIVVFLWNSPDLSDLSPAFRFGFTAVSTPKTSGDQFIYATPARVIARPFDGMRLLKVGDLVVVRGSKAPSLQQVAATPNETVLLRRGNSLNSLYLLGEGSYVVISNRQTSTIRADEICATLAGTSPF